MAEGTLIAESLRVGTELAGPRISVRRIHRETAELSPEQSAHGLAPVWTLIDFDVGDDEAAQFSEAVSRAIEPFGWYANLQSARESFVIFTGRVFRYARGDRGGRAAAQGYARAHGTPDSQLDWTV